MGSAESRNSRFFAVFPASMIRHYRRYFVKLTAIAAGMARNPGLG
jgi:hypothetical protein